MHGNQTSRAVGPHLHVSLSNLCGFNKLLRFSTYGILHGVQMKEGHGINKHPQYTPLLAQSAESTPAQSAKIFRILHNAAAQWAGIVHIPYQSWVLSTLLCSCASPKL